jgi:predicted nucleic acid-binding protein
MGEKYLIDTDAVIWYLNNSYAQPATSFLDEVLDEESSISFITRIELLVWDFSSQEDAAVFENFVRDSAVLGINEDIIQSAITVRKNAKIKLPDALIAATAIVNNYTLISNNEKDFSKVVSLEIGLKYMNPMKMI